MHPLEILTVAALLIGGAAFVAAELIKWRSDQRRLKRLRLLREYGAGNGQLHYGGRPASKSKKG